MLGLGEEEEAAIEQVVPTSVEARLERLLGSAIMRVWAADGGDLPPGDIMAAFMRAREVVGAARGGGHPAWFEGLALMGDVPIDMLRLPQDEPVVTHRVDEEVGERLARVLLAGQGD